MRLKKLSILNLRNIDRIEIQLSTNLNFIEGLNSAGKTSVLEAIDLLSRGRTFRTRQTKHIIKYGTEKLTVSAFAVNEHGNKIQIGLEKTRKQKTLYHQGLKNINQALMAEKLPVQVLQPQELNLITGPPKQRRSFLDWGVFHVEHEFYGFWSSYRRNLLQRNSALKKRYPKKYCSAWNNELSDSAVKISALRENYLNMLKPYLTYYSSLFGDTAELSLNYKKGWPKGSSLKSLLTLTLSEYPEKSPTPIGPHLADLEILLDGRPLKEMASRGQQKIFASILKLAQLKLLKEKTGKSAVFLIDDLSSELDAENRRKLFLAILDLNVQTFISVLAFNLFELDLPFEYGLFHVEHGKILNLN